MLEKRDLLSGMLEKRVIYLNEAMTAEVAREFGMALAWLNSQNSEEVKLYIDCSGGNVTAGLDMYDMIRHSKAPVTGIVYRRAYSMASIALQACQKRYAMSHANILIHSLRINEMSLDEFNDDISLALEQMRDNVKPLAEKICQRQNNLMEISDLLNLFLTKLEGGLGKTLSTAREKQELIVDIYLKHTKKNSEEIRATLREDKAMSAQEALAYGLIDEVI